MASPVAGNDKFPSLLNKPLSKPSSPKWPNDKPCVGLGISLIPSSKLFPFVNPSSKLLPEGRLPNRLEPRFEPLVLPVIRSNNDGRFTIGSRI